jgi:hypothetical protein
VSVFVMASRMSSCRASATGDVPGSSVCLGRSGDGGTDRTASRFTHDISCVQICKQTHEFQHSFVCKIEHISHLAKCSGKNHNHIGLISYWLISWCKACSVYSFPSSLRV